MTTALGVDRVASREVDLPSMGKIGFLTNYAARTQEGQWSGEAIQRAGYTIAFFLAPEHGLEALEAAGAKIPHAKTGAMPVLSMYGADSTHVEEALSSIDAVLVDLQDVGCRYYTYSWTIRELMRMAGQLGKPMVILDRPNPLGGVEIEGNVPLACDSAVCASPVPVRHGLTIGELARYNRRHFQIDVELSVVAMRGWTRSMLWEDTGLPFVPPSPNLRSRQAVALYPGTCLIEGTNVSEGRGTDAPFQVVGAPFVDAELLADLLTGVEASPTTFVPSEGKWVGEICHGVRIVARAFERADSVETGLAMVSALSRLPGFAFREGFFDALAGTGEWRERIEGGTSVGEITAAWRGDEARFRIDREQVLLY